MVQPYRQLVEKAVAAGFEVVSIWDPTLQTPDYLREVASHSVELLHADFTDEAALRTLIRETARTHDVAHVLHLGKESTMLPAALEADALGLALNPPEAVRRLNDKAAMRALLAAHALSPMRSATTDTPRRSPRTPAGLRLPGDRQAHPPPGQRGRPPGPHPGRTPRLAEGVGELLLRRSGGRRGVPRRPRVQRRDAQRGRGPPGRRHHRQAGHRRRPVRGDRPALPGPAARRNRRRHGRVGDGTARRGRAPLRPRPHRDHPDRRRPAHRRVAGPGSAATASRT